MKPEAIEKYFMINGQAELTKNAVIFKAIEKPPIYEVIRVIDKIPLFLEEHLNRMRKSADIINYQIERNDREIEADIEKLIRSNNINDLNIKLLCTDIDGIGQVFLVYFTETFYPPKTYYENGIHTILFYFERENPNAKIERSSFKEDISIELRENNAFEALLLNKDGYIPEGSKSNVFFVKNNKIFTAPKGDVLLGITRKYIFEVCEELNIEIIEENIHRDDLAELQGAFISGTSVNVLPISSIDGIRLDSVNNGIIRQINKVYMNKMKEYIDEKTL